MRWTLPVLVPCLLGLAALGCDKQKPPPAAPETMSAASVDDADPVDAEETEAQGAQGEGQGDDTVLLVATFNVHWAHDHDGEATNAAKKARAKDEKAWAWKADAIGKVLAAKAPQIVALQELGGEDEIYDVIEAVEKHGGPQYEHAFVKSEDPFHGHQVAILSTFPLTNSRRLDIHLRRHTAVDVDLPDDQQMTVVAIHAPEGERGKASRRKQIKALKRSVEALRKKAPVLVLGTLGSGVSPREEGYAASAGGMLAGKSTRREDDDCFDAIDVGAVLSTTRGGSVEDTVYACGVEIVDAEASDEGIINGPPDDAKKPWSEIPVKKDDERDVSDHLILVAKVKRPMPPPPPEEEASGEDAEGEKTAKNDAGD